MNIQVKPNCNKQISYKRCEPGQDSKVGEALQINWLQAVSGPAVVGGGNGNQW
jgi:hypothetical protein